MRTSKAPSTFLAGLALLSMAFTNSPAAPTAAAPVGWLNYPVTNGTITAFGVPVLDLPKFVGFTTAVAANTLTVSGVTWTVNQYSATPHFVTIRSGAQAGRTLRVTANTATVLTVDPEDTPLNTAGFAVTANTDSFELFAGDTLGTLFGSAADGTGTLPSGVKAGTSTTTADVIYIPSGTTWASYYFSTTLGFWVPDGGTTNQNNVILYPDDGFLVFRNGATGSLNMIGRVPSSKLLSKFPGGTTNFISLRFPADTTLAGLNFGAPGTWITGADDTVADTISIWNAPGYYWQSYFKNASNQWIEVGGDGSDQSSLVIPMGASIQIEKKGSATGSASFYSQALPYTY
jgi:uncharacterized protein (TIGR02597 family)